MQGSGVFNDTLKSDLCTNNLGTDLVLLILFKSHLKKKQNMYFIKKLMQIL